MLSGNTEFIIWHDHEKLLQLSAPPSSVRVTAPARLHLGFLDPGATLGRQFGSIGMALDGIATRVAVEAHDEFIVTGLVDERVLALVDRVIEDQQLSRDVRITIETRIDEHAGLGSGTQLALALGTALTHHAGSVSSSQMLARLLARGKRSGTGLGLFQRGGLIVDGGRGADAGVPPLIAQSDVPEAWRVILVSDQRAAGFSGDAEVSAFAALQPLSREGAARLCHHTLMGVLPALAVGDFPAFCTHVGAVQTVIGEHFSASQGGSFTSPGVGRVMAFCAAELALTGIGQSSWGPTAFAFVPDAERAAEVVDQLEQNFDDDSAITFSICTPRNRGADIEITNPSKQRLHASG